MPSLLVRANASEFANQQAEIGRVYHAVVVEVYGRVVAAAGNGGGRAVTRQ